MPGTNHRTDYEDLSENHSQMRILGSLASSFLNSGAEAAVLSGSRTSILKDQASDWDIYVYSLAPIDRRIRKDIYSALSLSSIVGMTFFEESDEAVDSHGNIYDIMFRSKEWTEWQVDDVYRRGNARIGYTTCILYNIAHSRIISSASGWFERIKEEISGQYPDKLRENIIRKNIDVIDGDYSSPFIRQLELAAERGDIVSQNHRMSAILASYFDVLFAYNRVYHPGEKRLIPYASSLCISLPYDMEKDICSALNAIGSDRIVPAAAKLIEELHMLIDRKGLLHKSFLRIGSAHQ